MKVMTKMKYQIPKFEYYTINLTSITLWIKKINILLILIKKKKCNNSMAIR